ncbi:MAG: hypothetical protein QM778_38920 [Myxococcales bacterium]
MLRCPLIRRPYPSIWFYVVCLTWLVGCAGSSKLPLRQSWHLVETQDIRLRSNDTLADTRAWAEQMQTVYAMFAQVMPCKHRTNDVLVEVVMLGDWDDFHAVAPENAIGYHATPNFEIAESHSVIVLSPNDGPEKLATFKHEIAHRLLHRCIPEPPIWLTEGVATFMETAYPVDDTLVVGTPKFVLSEQERWEQVWFENREVILVPASFLAHAPALFSMDSSTFHAEGDAAAGEISNAHYALASLAVRAMQFDDGPLLRSYLTYLRELAQGTDAEVALEAAFGEIDLAAVIKSSIDPDAISTRSVPIDQGFRPRIASAPENLAEGQATWAELWIIKEQPERARQHLQLGLAIDAYAPRLRELELELLVHEEKNR